MNWTVKWTKGRARGVEERYEGGCVADAFLAWCREHRDIPMGAVESVSATPERWSVVLRQRDDWWATLSKPFSEKEADTTVGNMVLSGALPQNVAKIPWPFPI